MLRCWFAGFVSKFPGGRRYVVAVRSFSMSGLANGECPRGHGVETGACSACGGHFGGSECDLLERTVVDDVEDLERL